jgi:uncharacterized Zn finger protein
MLVTVCPECGKVNGICAATYIREAHDVFVNQDATVRLELMEDAFSVTEEIVTYCSDCGWEDHDFMTKEEIEDYMRDNNIIQEAGGIE